MIVFSGNNQELKVLGKTIDTVAIRPIFGHSIIAAGRNLTESVTEVWTRQNAVWRASSTATPLYVRRNFSTLHD
jgi:hypothetical protein